MSRCLSSFSPASLAVVFPRRPQLAGSTWFFLLHLFQKTTFVDMKHGFFTPNQQCLARMYKTVLTIAETICGNSAEVRGVFVAWQNVVADRLCGDATRLTTEPCTVACPGDCLLSDWTSWSSCSQTCSSGRAAGYRTRFRQILAVPTDPGNATRKATFTPEPAPQRNATHRNARQRVAPRNALRYIACCKPTVMHLILYV